MAFYADRVKDTTTTTGTGNITLAGSPPTGYQSFNTAFGTSVNFYYCIEGGAEWEVGQGHLSASTTLVRDIILSSTNSNAAVSFSAGTKNVFCTMPADLGSLGRWVYKSSTTSRTSTTTLAADPHLTFSMAANSIYAVEMSALLSTASATPGIKWRYTITGAASQAAAIFTEHNGTLGNAPLAMTISNRLETGDTGTTNTMTGTIWGHIRFRGQIQTNASSASTFNFEWAQNSSSVDASNVWVGSWMRYARLS